MPRKEPAKDLQQLVDEVGVYPAEAYLFVQQGLNQTVKKIHEKLTDPEASRHISGQQLCEGLRDLALTQWGLLANVVLQRWNITTTMDFGRIVFAMIEHQLLQKTDEDSLDDFRQVFDFHSAFETGYRIHAPAEIDRPKRAVKKS